MFPENFDPFEDRVWISTTVLDYIIREVPKGTYLAFRGESSLLPNNDMGICSIIKRCSMLRGIDVSRYWHYYFLEPILDDFTIARFNSTHPAVLIANYAPENKWKLSSSSGNLILDFAVEKALNEEFSRRRRELGLHRKVS